MKTLTKLLSLVLAVSFILPSLVGLPLKSIADELTNNGNIAYQKPTRTNSTTGDSSKVTDGSSSTLWTAEDYPKYVDIDLMDNYEITKIELEFPKNTSWGFKIYGSLDGVQFTEMASQPYDKSSKQPYSIELDSPVYRIIRVNVNYSHDGLRGVAKLNEVKVYGEKSDTPTTEIREKLEFTTYEEWLSEKHGVTVKDGYDIKDTFTVNDTYEALYGIVTRILGEKYKDWFIFEKKASTNGNNYYELSNSGEKIKITGDEGVSMAMGLNYYLKYYCNVHVSQQTAQVKMPEKVVELDKTIRTESPYEVRYAYNYCTLSYTMPFYGFDDWQRELDYLMLSGVNLILDTTGIEAMWISFLQKYGYTVDEAKNFLSGYAYKAWWLMGNLENYGGQVADAWVYDTLEMARTNQRFMTVMGAQPCLTAFVGNLPTSFHKIAQPALTSQGFSNIASSLIDQGTWSYFKQPPLLRNTYDGYKSLAETFYDTQKEIYGSVTNYYSGDLAHEGGIIPDDLDLKKLAVDILDCMKAENKEATWVLQSWWGTPRKEILDGIGKENQEEHFLILELNSTIEPMYNSTNWGAKEWNGTSWVYCMLDNFGGRPNVHGELEYMKDSILDCNKKMQHLKGIGLVSEGTQMNPVCQELLWEMAWRTEDFDINTWIHNYAERRYGIESESINQAWDILLDTAYGYSGYHYFSTVCIANLIPSFNPSAVYGYYGEVYSHEEFEKAVDLFMTEFDKLADNECFVYDAVDLLKQQLSNSMSAYFNTYKSAYDEKNEAVRKLTADKILNSIKLLDIVCQYQVDSTMGEWEGRIYDFVNESDRTYSDFDIDTMKFNARAIISAWCSKILHTYAHRQYSGALIDYNYKMWEAFFLSVENGYPTTDESFYFKHAWNFIVDDKDYDRTVLPAKGSENTDSLYDVYLKIKNEYKVEDSPLTDTIKYNIAPDGEPYAESGQAIANLNDGDDGSLWIKASSNFPSYAGIKFDGKKTVDKIIIVSETRQVLGSDVMEFSIEAKINGKWKEIATAKSYDAKTKKYTAIITLDEPIQTNDIRVSILSVTAGSKIWPAIGEIKIISYNKLTSSNNDLCKIDELYNITDVKEGTTVKELLSGLEVREGELEVVDKDGKKLGENDNVTNGVKVIHKLNGEEFSVYTVSEMTDDKPIITPETTPETTGTATETQTPEDTDAIDTLAPINGNGNDTVIIVIVICASLVLITAMVFGIILIKSKKKD